jgi:general transcription factor 3C polypeptide 3 (transcription factor C subunit 4)
MCQQFHFSFLEPEDESSNGYFQEHPDLFRDIGDALRNAGLHQEALRYYEPLQKGPDGLDSRFTFDIAICYQALGRDSDVRRSIQALKNTARDANFYIGLAKLYQSQGKDSEMWHLINQLKRMGKSEMIRKAGLPVHRDGAANISSEPSSPSVSPRSASAGRGDSMLRELRKSAGPARAKQKRKQKRQRDGQLKDGAVRAIYESVTALQPAVDAGDREAAAEWLCLANRMFEDFRNQSLFFPRDKSTKFTGFNKWKRTVTLPANEDLVGPEEQDDDDVPTHYRTVHFEDWSDLLMRVALHHAKSGDKDECWQVLNVIQSANVFMHEPSRIQMIRNVALGMFPLFDSQSLIITLNDQPQLVH